MKRLRIILIAALLSALLLISVASADAVPTLSFDDAAKSINNGESTTIALRLTGIPQDIYVFEFAITYDPSKLQLTGIQNGDVFTASGAPTVNSQNAGIVYVNWDNLDYPLRNDCVLFQLTFRAITAETCTTTVGISSDNDCYVAYNDLKETVPTIKAGTIRLNTSEQPAFDGTIEWDAADVRFNGKTPYVIADGQPQTPRFTVKAQDGSVVDPSNYTYEYLENVNAGTAYVMITFTDTYCGMAQGWFKIYLPATDYTMVENRDDGIYIEWHAVDGASGYVIYRRAWSSTTGGKWTDFVRWNNTTNLYWIDKTVYAGTRYQYGIKAYFERRVDPVSGATIGGNVGDNYNLGQVGPLKTTVRITTRKLNSVTPGKKQLTIKWAGSSLFTGYEVQIATDAAFTKNVKTVKITNPKTYQTTIKSLKAKTTYYVRVRSYHVFEGMTYFGGWSNVLSGKTK